MSKQQTNKATNLKNTDTGSKTETFYTVEHTASLLGLAEKTIRHYCHSGEIKAYKRAGRWYIFHQDLTDFIKAGNE